MTLRTCILSIAWICLLGAEDAGRGIRKVEVSTGNGTVIYVQSHALVIGCSSYTAWPRLGGVADDVDTVKVALERQGFAVATLLDPTLAQLRQGLDGFVATHGMAPDNRLLLYFAGHGHTATLSDGRQMGYIVPVDAPDPAQNAVAFRSGAIDMRTIETLAERIESRHALFVFDSCFSGTLFALRAATQPAVAADAMGRPVRHFITSGSAGEMVPDLSVFRRFFIRGIEGEADFDGNGLISGTELGAFLYTRTTEQSRGTQNPQTAKIRNLDLNQGEFLFSSPKGRKAGSPTVPQAGPQVTQTPSGAPSPAAPASGEVTLPMQATDAPRRVRVMTRDRRELVGVYDPLQQLILMEMPGGHVSLKLQLTDIVAWLPPPAATPALGGDSDIMPRTINRNSLAALVARLLDRAPPSPGTVIPVAFAWGQLGGVPENGYNLDPKSGAFVSNGYVYGYPQAVKGFHLREDGYNWMRNGEWPPKGFEERFRSLRLRSFALSETPKLVRLRQRMDEDQLISMCSFDLQADAIVTETHVDLVDVVIASDIIVCPSFPKQGRPHTIQAHENP